MSTSKKTTESLHKVIILGAGATRGASIYESKSIKPPLDNDFFSILEKLSCKNKKLRDWLKQLRDCMGIPLNGVSMESVFTKLETLANFLPKIKPDKGPTVKRHKNLLNKYSLHIAYCFNEIKRINSSEQESCEYHNKIVKSLTTNDCIISFNYDCLIDAALKTSANKKWNASSGYGIDFSGNVDKWHEHKGKKGKKAKQSIKLLKLHGSLNWKIGSNSKIELRDYQARYGTNDRSFNEIIPPVWNKDISERSHFNKIWEQARIALQNANTLVIIGYSLPDTDLLSQALLQIDTAKKRNSNLKTLTIVNPDPFIRKKIINILNNSINSSTRILEYNTLKEYSNTLDNSQ